MPLGADYEEPARINYLLMLGLELIFELFVIFVVLAPCLNNLLVVGLGKAGRLGDQLVRKPFLYELVARHIFGVSAENNIGTAARHIRCDCNSTFFACLCDDFRLFCVEFRVQDLVLYALAFQKCGQNLGFVDVHRADEHRLPLFVALLNLADYRHILAALGLVDAVVKVLSDNRLVCGHGNNVQTVNLLELVLLGERRTGHTGKLCVHTEEILEGDCRESAALVLDIDALFCLNRLVQTVGIASARHNAAGKFIDDEHLPVLYDILPVAVHYAVCVQRLI